jgi:hypothetical protein
MIKTRVFLEGKPGPEKSRVEKALVEKAVTICTEGSTREPENSMGVEDKLVKMV